MADKSENEGEIVCVVLWPYPNYKVLQGVSFEILGFQMAVA